MSAITTQIQDDVLVVFFNDSRMLDDPRIQQTGNELVQAAEQSEQPKLLLNFREVKFMSSAMLGKLMLLHKKCKASGVQLKMCNISPDIMEVFKMMRLHKILDIYKDEDRALAAFAKRGLFS